MTSSWYSEARWVISTAWAAAITSSVVAVAELRGEQGEHRAHALAAGVEQVAARDIRDRRRRRASASSEPLLDAARGPSSMRVDEAALVARREQLLAEAERRAQGAAAASEGTLGFTRWPILIGSSGRVGAVVSTGRGRARALGRGEHRRRRPACGRGAGRRCPPVRLRYATRVKPAPRIHWLSWPWSGHSWIDSAR